ncbi:hypothetical protein BXZ70DRAFT_913579 [Cristinia sonorae]|uniref:Uncharacterized protein n=1 Tax=Cristinia sonorae TaxID=1940300 RepID=A0A8K0UZY6_9AGAR|nr:hypothetical protein BXZ70DRAFT_913579 [Cristinia sonorae]
MEVEVSTAIGVPYTPEQPATAPHADSGPVPMSFPAILRTAGLANRFAHLSVGLTTRSEGGVSLVPKKNRRDDKAGKQWVRRKDNARFVGNPHIVAPSSKDYVVTQPIKRSTFPEPLPVYLSRNSPIPPASPAVRDPNSANAGRFSVGLKGVRRKLRNAGPRVELLVEDIEEEILGWLRNGGVLLDPDAQDDRMGRGRPIGSTGGIMEVSRTPLQLVWSIAEDPFARYVVHCCARYHRIVSFSKDTTGQRLTYLLRPNVTRPDFAASAALATPPATESEHSAFELDSDFAADTDASSVHFEQDDSDMEGAPPPLRGSLLEDIAESAPGSPLFAASHPPGPQSVDGWSVIGDSDMEREEGESDRDLASSVGSLSLEDPIAIVAAGRRHSVRRRVPSRRLQARVEPPASLKGSGRSFYDYLYS